MNCLWIESYQSRLTLDQKQSTHVLKTLKLNIGDRIRIAIKNDRLGWGTICAIENNLVTIEPQLGESPPESSPLEILLALPRPKAIGRIIHNLIEFGVKKITLIQAAKVEPSYWSAHQISDSYLNRIIVQALQQSVDSMWPQIEKVRLFRPYVEDHLPQLKSTHDLILAHPGKFPLLPERLHRPTLAAIGPEGGWVDFEVNLLRSVGFTPYQLGPRILRSENAVSAVASRAVRTSWL